MKTIKPHKVIIRSYRERTYTIDARTPEEAIASVELEAPESDEETIEDEEAFPVEEGEVDEN
jgi:hypothetical protein